ncbi:MAG: DUF2273 domain-containing protein [Syntrophomonadaceae bacterium]|jgi:uncharacterized membrane protein|nr:DUF2273 domain-containing protein [Syntrophomonadaceae bacterium]
MWDRVMYLLLVENRGKTVGILLGLLAAILFVSYGFFKTLFIIICIATGYFIGKQLDENKDFENWLNRIFKK